MTIRFARALSLVCLVVAVGCGGGSHKKKDASPDGILASDGSVNAKLDGAAGTAGTDAAGGTGGGAGSGVMSDAATDGATDETGTMIDTALPVVMLVGVDVNPALASVAGGTSISFVATGRFSDGTTKDLTVSAAWSSSVVTVATVSGGVAKALAMGTSVITATSMGFSGSASLTVTAATLGSLAIEPADAKIPVTAKQAFKATGLFSDGTKQDLTTQVAWQSSDTTVASIGPDGVALCVKAGTTDISAAMSGKTAKVVLTVTPATLKTIEITPVTPSLPLPGSQRFVATGVFSDGSTTDITSVVTWESSDKAVLVFSTTAGTESTALSISSGTAVVTAKLGMVSGSTAVTVLKATLSSIKVLPESANVPKGLTQTYKAMGTYSDGTMVDVTTAVAWSAADEKVAALSNATGSQGVATGLLIGDTDVIATQGAISGKAKISVTTATLSSLAIAPKAASIPAGRKQQYTATATYSDQSTKDVTVTTTWTTTDGTVASVSNAAATAGLLSATKVGSADVTGTFGGKTDTTKVTVTGAVLDSITVKPDVASVVAGLRQAFTATGNYSDASTLDLTTQVTWSSDDTAIASIANADGIRGQAVAMAPGKTTIHAKLDGKDGAAALTVTAPTLTQLSLSPLLPTRRVGENVQFGASAIASNGTSQNVTLQATWATSAPNVATINATMNPRGRATCVMKGQTTITATYMGVSSNIVLTCTDPVLTGIQVTPFVANIIVGQQVVLTATGLFSDGTTSNLTMGATWASADQKVADVTNNAQRGRVSGVATGTTMITATYMGFTASMTVSVTVATVVALSVSPVVATVRVGQMQQFQAIAVLSDGTTRNVTNMSAWTSSDPTVAGVTNMNPRGQTAALKAGTSKISAAYMGFMDSGTLTATAAQLTGITVSPLNARIRVGQNQAYQAVALFDDGSTQNVTGQAFWDSSDGAVAAISNAAGGTRGQATGLKAGTTMIAAHFMTFSDTVTLTVTSSVLTRISVSPAATTLLVGQTQQFQAMAIFDDGTTQNVTNQSLWASSDSNVADVSNGGGGGRGTVAALTGGTAKIKATYSGQSDEGTVTVSAAKIKSIALSPLSATISLDETQTFQAIATYDDNTTRNVTQQAIWASSAPLVADVSTGAGARGVVTALKVGTTTIKATVMAISGTATLTVDDAKLTSIQLTPINASVPKGMTQQYQATGSYSNNTTRTITAQALWASSSDLVADVSNAGGSRGLVTALGEGSVDISATVGAVSGKTKLTVTSATILEIQVTPTNPVILVGGFAQFTATVVYADFSIQNVTGAATWSSSNEAAAQVSNAGGSRGRTSGIASGTAVITATYMGASGTTGITVTSATIKEIQVVPTNPGTPAGLRTQFLATAVLTDTSTLDVTATAAWTSADESIVSISNAGGSRGLANALKAGSAKITATLSGVSGFTVYTVGAQTLSSIAVTPASGTVAKGATLPFTATGTYSDTSTFDLTTYVTWISTSSGVATVSNAAGSRGLATGVATGSTSIDAHFSGVTGSTPLGVP